ncbi:MAG: DUF1292 domain-containing protein [Lachnospiraceae bacterium]|nr:DUF1292 domain-containing protein [Lachnospiraceae bacterium]
MEQIEFFDTQSGEKVRFYVLEQTKLGGEQYLLVTDLHPDDEDAMAYIFRAVGDDGADMTYEEVDDEETLGILSGIFEELLEDTSLQ